MSEAPYCRAAAFADEQQAGRVYQRIQDLLFAATKTDLSAYRFYSGSTWYVAIVGETPSAEIDRQVTRLLERGVVTTLPDAFIAALMQRRAEATRLGPWVEGHYGDGDSEP
jgi:hypothetical protein